MKLADFKLDSLLIYHDWLIDNNKEKESEEIKELKTNDWLIEDLGSGVGTHSLTLHPGVGTIFWSSDRPGTPLLLSRVGCFFSDVGN